MSPFARHALAQPELDRPTELDLARRAAGGDRSARERLIETGLRWVVLHALRRGIAGEEFEDAVQDGIVALIGAVDRFETERGVRLATFAWQAIDGAMTRRRPPEPSLPSVGPPTAAPLPPEDLLDGLHEREMRLLQYRFGLDGSGRQRSRREVAELFGVSEAQVRRQEERALARLRRQWGLPGVASSGQSC